jgi:hypothetical protein
MQPGYGGMAPSGGSMQQAGPPGQIRNPVLSMLAIMFCCPWYSFWQCKQTEGELHKFLGRNDDGTIMWMVAPIMPALNARKLIAEARAKAGTPTQGEPGFLGYLFFYYWNFLKDANEIWESQGVKKQLLTGGERRAGHGTSLGSPPGGGGGGAWGRGGGGGAGGGGGGGLEQCGWGHTGSGSGGCCSWGCFVAPSRSCFASPALAAG